jgi:hypothetical protein
VRASVAKILVVDDEPTSGRDAPKPVPGLSLLLSVYAFLYFVVTL